jgi:leucyl/phenylalanyl-tRNA--protein transferase
MTRRNYRDWESFDMSTARGDCPAAFCGDLSPASVLSAYKKGIVPFPAHNEYGRIMNEFRYEDQVAEGVIAVVGDGQYDPYSSAWWSPDPRLLVKVENAHISHNVRKRLRRLPEWATTANRAYQRVAEQCRVGREPCWLTDVLLESLNLLHEAGWAHSVEVWEEGNLIGGAIGIGIGQTVSGDSMFNRRPGASKVAVADMAARFAEAGASVIDAQWDSPYLRSLGAEPMPRRRYLELLAASSRRLAPPRQVLPAQRLIGLTAA